MSEGPGDIFFGASSNIPQVLGEIVASLQATAGSAAGPLAELAREFESLSARMGSLNFDVLNASAISRQVEVMQQGARQIQTIYAELARLGQRPPISLDVALRDVGKTGLAEFSSKNAGQAGLEEARRAIADQFATFSRGIQSDLRRSLSGVVDDVNAFVGSTANRLRGSEILKPPTPPATAGVQPAVQAPERVSQSVSPPPATILPSVAGAAKAAKDFEKQLDEEVKALENAFRALNKSNFEEGIGSGRLLPLGKSVGRDVNTGLFESATHGQLSQSDPEHANDLRIATEAYSKHLERRRAAGEKVLDADGRLQSAEEKAAARIEKAAADQEKRERGAIQSALQNQNTRQFNEGLASGRLQDLGRGLGRDVTTGVFESKNQGQLSLNIPEHANDIDAADAAYAKIRQAEIEAGSKVIAAEERVASETEKAAGLLERRNAELEANERGQIQAALKAQNAAQFTEGLASGRLQDLGKGLGRDVTTGVFESKTQGRLSDNLDEHADEIVAANRAYTALRQRQISDGEKVIASERDLAAANERAAVTRAREQAKPQGILPNLASGFLSSGFGGGGGGLPPNINSLFDGLARSAGTTLKYTALYQILGQLQGVLSDVVTQFLDANDSVTELDVAMGHAGEVTGSFVNSLGDVAAVGGFNVGEAMDVAASGIRAFGSQAEDATRANEALGASFATQASRIAVLSKTSLTDAAGNLKAIAAGFELPKNNLGFTQAADAIAGAKLAGGGDEKQIGQGLANSALIFKELGFSLNESATIISRINAETDESGTLIANRVSRLSQIIGGTTGKNFIASLNQTIPNPAERVDTQASTKDQLLQLAKIYRDASTSIKAQIVSALGGTAQARETIILLSQLPELTKKADAGFEGKATKEFQQRLENVRAQLQQIKGNVDQIIVNIANSGVAAPILALVEGLRAATSILREVTQLLNLIPKGFIAAAASAAALYGTIRLIGAVSRAGGIGGFARRIEEAALPQAALARQTLADRRTGGDEGSTGRGSALAGVGSQRIRTEQTIIDRLRAVGAERVAAEEGRTAGLTNQGRISRSERAGAAFDRAGDAAARIREGVRDGIHGAFAAVLTRPIVDPFKQSLAEGRTFANPGPLFASIATGVGDLASSAAAQAKAVTAAVTSGANLARGAIADGFTRTQRVVAQGYAHTSQAIIDGYGRTLDAGRQIAQGAAGAARGIGTAGAAVRTFGLGPATQLGLDRLRTSGPALAVTGGLEAAGRAITAPIRAVESGLLHLAAALQAEAGLISELGLRQYANIHGADGLKDAAKTAAATIAQPFQRIGATSPLQAARAGYSLSGGSVGVATAAAAKDAFAPAGRAVTGALTAAYTKTGEIARASLASVQGVGRGLTQAFAPLAHAFQTGYVGSGGSLAAGLAAAGGHALGPAAARAGSFAGLAGQGLARGFSAVSNFVGGPIGIAIAGVTIASELNSAANAIGEATRNIQDLKKKPDVAAGEAPRTYTSEELLQRVSQFKTGRQNADEARSGFFGSIADNLTGGAGSRAVADAQLQTALTEAEAARAKAAEQSVARARLNSRNPGTQIDSTSAQGVTDSLTQLAQSGRGAAFQMLALKASIDLITKSGKTGTTFLDAAAQQKVASAGDEAATNLIQEAARPKIHYRGETFPADQPLKPEDFKKLFDEVPSGLGPSFVPKPGVTQTPGFSFSKDQFKKLQDVTNQTILAEQKKGVDLGGEAGKQQLAEDLKKAYAGLLPGDQLTAAALAAATSAADQAAALATTDAKIATLQQDAINSITAASAHASEAGNKEKLRALTTGTQDKSPQVSANTNLKDLIDSRKSLAAAYQSQGLSNAQIASALEGLDNQINAARIAKIEADNALLKQEITENQQARDVALAGTKSAAQKRRIALGFFKKDIKLALKSGDAELIRSVMAAASAAEIADYKKELEAIIAADQAAAAAEAIRNKALADLAAATPSAGPISSGAPARPDFSGPGGLFRPPPGQHTAKDQLAKDKGTKQSFNDATTHVTPSAPYYGGSPASSSASTATAAQIAAAEAAAEAERRRDSLAAARANVAKARADYAAAKSGTIEKANALQALYAAENALADAQRDAASSARRIGEFKNSAVQQARLALRDAAANLHVFAQGTKEFNDAQNAYIQAQRDLVAAQRQAYFLHLTAGSDLTDPVIQARLKLREAAAKLAQDRKAGAPRDVIDQDKVDLKNAQNTAEATAFQQRFNDAKTNDELGRISHTAYLQYLQNEHDRLTKIRGKTRQQKDELNQIDEAIKSANDQLSGQFNIGDIKVPTIYEVRRAISNATGSNVSAVQNSVVNNNQQVTINGADFAKVVDYLKTVMGPAGSARLSIAPRKG